MLVWVSSSAFFSRDITHTFLFCLQRVAAARFLSRNLRRRSSGSSSTTRLRRPPLGGPDCSVCVGCICCAAGDNCTKKKVRPSCQETNAIKSAIHHHYCMSFCQTSRHPANHLSNISPASWEVPLKQHMFCARACLAL